MTQDTIVRRFASRGAFLALAAAAAAASGASATIDTNQAVGVSVYQNGNDTNITLSPAPSQPPSLSPMPTAANATNVTSPMPSVSPMPSSPPSISYPPTMANTTHPPSVSPMPSSPPSAPPTPDTSHKGGGGGFFHKLYQVIKWSVIACLTALAFSWLVTNHRRILPLLGEMWYRIRTTDWRRFFTNLASNTREFCGGLYHRVRFGRWSFRGLGGRDFDTVPLNEIVFDPHDSGDPTELLLSRER
mmetsp:Transcript_34716/g.75983  ORF Transcript_34716/g.75983 Transcript_34716/m.75983 type:complete len:245 (+) Transcript_34716:173-907(+)